MFYSYITIFKFLGKLHDGNQLWIGLYVYFLFIKLKLFVNSVCKSIRKIKMLIY
jgi:hypothetical protein